MLTITLTNTDIWAQRDGRKSELSTSFSGVYYKHESDPLFIGDKENEYKDFTVFELLKFLSSFVNLATIQSLYSHTVFDFDFQ